MENSINLLGFFFDDEYYCQNASPDKCGASLEGAADKWFVAFNQYKNDLSQCPPPNAYLNNNQIKLFEDEAKTQCFLVLKRVCVLGLRFLRMFHLLRLPDMLQLANILQNQFWLRIIHYILFFIWVQGTGSSMFFMVCMYHTCKTFTS